MRPTCPPPTKQYVAAQRAEHTKLDAGCPDAYAVLREQAPFWMLQAQIAYSVPDSSEDCADFEMKKVEKEYNTVSFTDTITKLQQDMQPGHLPGGGYLAMGSFFKGSGNAANTLRLQGRYYLTAVGSADWTMKNEWSHVEFAPRDSYILAFSGTENIPKPSFEAGEDFDWRPVEVPADFYPPGYVGPKAHNAMFEGVTCGETMTGALMQAGFVLAGTDSPNVGRPKEITIVGHSLGGGQAQLAAVHIALKYNAKVRVITYESIMAFTPETAKWIVEGSEGSHPHDKLIWPCEHTVTTAFPDVGGKIAAQRWVENDSPLSAAPLLLPAGGPVCLACNLCCWPYKFNLVGCWPFNSKLGDGYISKALVLSGFKAKLSASGKATAGGGPCAGCTGNGGPPYDDCEFDFHEMGRTYVTKGARRLRWFTCFPPCVLCNSIDRSQSHQQKFLLWMLYKGAYQNKTQGPAFNESKYVPSVWKHPPNQ
ncbi:hypothetical protein EMIHUDRAFT_110400 [Emiliania huxleyi CCMP1516]|uniref:Fungal lipase-type domain-containing protein n=2 Tax=Emiliania huxleyi TaxID=2903 RepID=A0A0D3KK75_EMIH1|nr:hypothetical protein EMIHUDRAFT_110400 [Emiliania huxleyi CCMP1516]EOD36160.1 hypothetical protein EMIHUDRAFT_110400 [Emiliania huxleyi CCMP1516]|eukprot:XP_005788589.1 hypothetical protein EMIHUDRAFT_110400 [Emiliania huxleyi CCMP1516]